MKKIFAGCCLFLLSFLSTQVVGQKFPRAALRSDLDTLYQTLQDVHPDLFAMAGRPKLDSIVANIRGRLDQADFIHRSYFHFYLLPLFEAIGDGHTTLEFYSRPSDVSPSFPLDVSMPDDSTLRIKRAWLPENNMLVGARIDSINGQGARELIRRFLVWVPGERLHFRLACLESLFHRYYYYWNTWYRTYRIQATLPDGTIYRDTVDAIPYRVRRLEQQEYDPYRFQILSDTVALLELRSLTGGTQFKSFLDFMFRELRERKIPNMIIDIRNNGGGSTAEGDMLLRYLSDKPFHQIEKGVIKFSRQIAEARLDIYYRPRYPKRYTDEMIMRKVNEKVPFRTLCAERNTKLRKPHPLHKRYRGKTWMLTSHYTYSSAANLSWAFKYFDMGTVVGEETGGMSVAFGNKVWFRLPHTGIGYSISYVKFYEYGATDEDIHGTLPDYPVPADQALDYTLDLIRQGMEKAE